jgi:membrane-associated phospholipid phosphatase
MPRGALTMLLLGAALLATVTVGVVLAVTRLYAEHRGFSGAIHPLLVDAGALAANGALLFALLRLNRFDRDSNEGREGDA